MIWDFAPIIYNVQIVNSSGDDLLDPNNSGSFDHGKIKVIFRGVEYSSNNQLPATKVYMPYFYGFKIEKRSTSVGERFVLLFGELDGSKNYSKEEIVILWGDGSSDRVKFNRKVKYPTSGNPIIKDEWFLNNAKIDKGSIVIRK